MAKRRTGLGTAAFFNTEAPTPATLAEGAGPPNEQQARSSKQAKVRTTVTFSPDTLTRLELLKVQARRGGERTTFSEILEDAIMLLSEQRGVTLSE